MRPRTNSDTRESRQCEIAPGLPRPRYLCKPACLRDRPIKIINKAQKKNRENIRNILSFVRGWWEGSKEVKFLERERRKWSISDRGNKIGTKIDWKFMIIASNLRAFHFEKWHVYVFRYYLWYFSIREEQFFFFFFC